MLLCKEKLDDFGAKFMIIGYALLKLLRRRYRNEFESLYTFGRKDWSLVSDLNYGQSIPEMLMDLDLSRKMDFSSDLNGVEF